MAKDPKNKKKFFKGFKAELKKVIWPTPKQLINNTTAVVVIVLITAVIVFALDLMFDFINISGVNRLKSSIQATNNVESENEAEDNTTESDSEEDNTAANEDAE